MKPKGEMVVLEVQVKFNLGDAVRVTNKFNPHYKQKGWVVGACKGPSEIIDDVDTIYYYVNIDDLLYKFAEREIKEDKVMDASDSTNLNQDLIEEYADEHSHDTTEEENKDVTYFGLVRGRTYKLKQNHYPMKEGDPVIIKDFDPIDSTSDDRADVLVFHALYGTQWVNHSELEDTIQPVKEKDSFKPGDRVHLKPSCAAFGITLPSPGDTCKVKMRSFSTEVECYYVTDSEGNIWYVPVDVMIPVGEPKDNHYDGEVQPIELMQAQMTKEAFIGFLRGNIIKYAARLGKKDAPEKEAKKIQTYANWLVKVLNNQEIHP